MLRVFERRLIYMISNPMAGPAESNMAYLTYYCQLWITPLTTKGAVWGLIHSVRREVPSKRKMREELPPVL